MDADELRELAALFTEVHELAEQWAAMITEEEIDARLEAILGVCPGHVDPIGFDIDEPDFEYHGESMHPAAVDGQCMCGHPDYLMCEYECRYLDPPTIQEEP